MSLDDEFNEFLEKPLKCKVCDWVKIQDDETRAFFNRHAPSNVAKITTFCQDRFGLDANETTVRKHVRGKNHVA